MNAVNMMLSDVQFFTALQVSAYHGHMEVCAWLLDDECAPVWMATQDPHTQSCRCLHCRDGHGRLQRERCGRCSYAGLTSPLHLDAFDFAALYTSRQQRGSGARARGLSVMKMIADASCRPTVPSARAVRFHSLFSGGGARRLARRPAVRTYFADVHLSSLAGAADALIEFACAVPRSLGQVVELAMNVVWNVPRDEVEQTADMLISACVTHDEISEAVDGHIRPTMLDPNCKLLRDMTDDSFRLVARLGWIEARPDSLLRLVMCRDVQEEDVLSFLSAPVNGLANHQETSPVVCSAYGLVAGLGFSAALDRIRQRPELWRLVDVDVVAKEILRGIACCAPHKMRFGRSDPEHELVARFARRSHGEVNAYVAHFIKIYRRCEPRHTRAWYAICCRHTRDPMSLYHPGMTEASLACLVWFGGLSDPAATHYKYLYEACVDGSHDAELANAASKNVAAYAANKEICRTVGGVGLGNMRWPGSRPLPTRALEVIVKLCVC